MMKISMESGGGIYSVKEYRDWVHKFNYGVNRLFTFPHTYDMSDMCFDMFHAKANVIKILLNHI